MERVDNGNGTYTLTAEFGKIMVGLVDGQEVVRVPSVTVVGNTAITWVEDYERVTEIWTPTTENINIE